MSLDPFDELLELEDNLYKEGFEAGVADSAYAGLVEGKVFGIEKGYEKAIEIGKARGRAMVWQQRLQGVSHLPAKAGFTTNEQSSLETRALEMDLSDVTSTLSVLPDNTRLKKHIDVLLSLTDLTGLPNDNSDESVSDLDERIVKIRARVKVISNLVGEAISPASISTTSIEDSTGLSARH